MSVPLPTIWPRHAITWDFTPRNHIEVISFIALNALHPLKWFVHRSKHISVAYRPVMNRNVWDVASLLNRMSRQVTFLLCIGIDRLLLSKTLIFICYSKFYMINLIILILAFNELMIIACPGWVTLLLKNWMLVPFYHCEILRCEDVEPP